MYCNARKNMGNLKKNKISYIFKKALSLSIVYSKCDHEYKKIFKEEESIELLKIYGLINNKKTYNHARIKHESRI